MHQERRGARRGGGHGGGGGGALKGVQKEAAFFDCLKRKPTEYRI